MGTDETRGANGCFVIPHYKVADYFFNVIVSDGMGWEHVSVSLTSNKRKVERCPTWEEMCYIKDLFWDEHETAIQYHPAKSEYVNNHQYCLHLWNPTQQDIPKPLKIMIGV